jgi:hypothetical protein
MRRISLLMITLILLCAFFTEGQQQLVNMIKGMVRDAATAPLAAVAMTATNLDSNAGRTGVSDAAGTYQFVNLPPGRYSILAQKAGYAHARVSLVKVAPGQHVDLAEIKMSRARSSIP